ncbi:hypothetical protein GCM10009839_74130 [Catenulispora yoronensis]|uniref:Uncharacterized protein n=1 Tax=Catenulispora yoronensis TaxID=450799 RepID=A0ABP5GRD9_9ACTN
MATEDTAPGTGDAAPRHRTSTTPPVAIHPFRGAAGVSFGAGRADVRQRLGAPAASYRAPAWQDQLSDHYPGLGLVIGYGDAGTVDRIELSAPARAEIDGVALLDASSRAVLTALAGVGLEVRAIQGQWEVPSWGVALSVQGDRAGDRPFRTVAAFAHGPAPEPAYFGTLTDESQTSSTGYPTPVEVDPRGAGPVRLGLPRPRIRALLGEGLASALPGRDTVDFHYDANIAVTYDAAEAARRICVMTADATIANLPSTIRVGAGYRDCVTALREADLPHEEHEAEILLTDLGIRLLTSRAGDRTLPITGIAVQRAPAL